MYLILLKQIVEQIKNDNREMNNKEIIRLKLSNNLLNELSKRKKLFRLEDRKGPISKMLADFLKVDPETKLSRSETVKLIMNYIDANGLKSSFYKNSFYVSNDLAKLFENNKNYRTYGYNYNFYYISRDLTKHFKIFKK